MKLLIQLAGITFELNTIYGNIWYFCKDFLTDNEKPDFIITLSQKEIDKEWERISITENNDDSLRQRSMYPILERKAFFRKIVDILSSRSVLLMHGSVISNGKAAYMFTAPSGTGKTTRAHLFIENHPDYYILNGDKPLVKVEDDRVVVYGSPWKGKECEGVNANAPLKAIFLLVRSDHTKITELKVCDAFGFLTTQTCIPANSKQTQNMLHLIEELEGKTKIFLFESTPTKESVEMALKKANDYLDI